MWKYIAITVIILSLGVFGLIIVKTNNDMGEAGLETVEIISPFSKLLDNKENSGDPEIDALLKENEYPLGNPVSILLLGIDRRSRSELGYRTDIMIQMISNPETNQVVLASIPRDLWYKGGRLNATYYNSGWEELQTAITQITGVRPERFILTDFKDFSWIVDAMGGVPVEVERTFSDSNYPVDETKGYQTISFTAGPETLTGERALIYARSRKGNNGEGSDWMRMQRQHKILKGMLTAVLSPKSIFNPMVVEKAFKTVTTGRMDTNLKVVDAKYLWDFYKDKDKYKIHSLYLDYDYLYSPPLEEYGGAWVLVPKSGSYNDFRKVVSDRLLGIENVVQENTVDTTSDATMEL